MKILSVLTTASVGLLLAVTVRGAGSTGSPFYGDPPDAQHPWCVHDWNRPQPPRVEPGPAKPCPPPAGAVVLCDGTEALLDKWEADKPEHVATKWIVRNNAMECVPKSGFVRTKEQFGDCQLHVEWAAPSKVEGDGQGRGNSGIFLPGGVEVQVLDNYDNPTYADGFACSVYSVCPPLANALRPPGEFQQIDITYRRPIYKDGQCVEPGYVTVYCNGVLVQDKTQLEGPTGHMRRTKPGPLAEGPLKLQDHGNPVRFRNIWLKPLPPREGVEAGIHGPLSAEATLAKRKEIAATVREDAAKHSDNPVAQMLRFAESLVYEKDGATLQKVEQMAGQYATGVQQLAGDKLSAKKDEVKSVSRAFQYLTKCDIIPADFSPKAELNKLIKVQGWDKEKK